MVQRYSVPFCAEGVPHGRGHRILMAQPDDETHSFGLSLVGEFFRRDGWDVVVARAGTGLEPVQCVRTETFDAVGLSVGSQLNLPWLRDRIARIRRESCNPSIVVMVGGPLFADRPERALEIGADLSSPADQAPARVLECLAGRPRAPSPSTDRSG
jgi:methanogenic corrinoid protein MtbC1